jgi:hypothetical protein
MFLITFSMPITKWGTNSFSDSAKKSGDPVLNSWRELLDDPNQWWDYRDSKRNGSVIAPLFWCLLYLAHLLVKFMTFLFSL